jgi:hypothetical protein
MLTRRRFLKLCETLSGVQCLQLAFFISSLTGTLLHIPLFYCDSNALKFTPSDGHVQVKASFIADTDDDAAAVSNSIVSASRVVPTQYETETVGKIRIEILDTGPGISEVSLILVI